MYNYDAWNRKVARCLYIYSFWWPQFRDSNIIFMVFKRIVAVTNVAFIMRNKMIAEVLRRSVRCWTISNFSNLRCDIYRFFKYMYLLIIIVFTFDEDWSNFRYASTIEEGYISFRTSAKSHCNYLKGTWTRFKIKNFIFIVYV